MIPGFYIASHPWLREQRVHKVGFTRDLRRRLHDSGYVLCFSPNDWKFASTIETSSAEEAENIETFVKEYYRERRPWGNELVRADASDIMQTAIRVAQMLGVLAVKTCTAPCYPRPPLVRRGAADGKRTSSPEMVRQKLAAAGLLPTSP